MANAPSGSPVARFAPRLLLQQLATDAGRSHDSVETIEAAALFLDISGFTPLTRRFAEQGPRGAEIVGEILERIYNALTERITAAGGDIIDFAGDGIIGLWPVEADGSLAASTRLAIDCALAIQQQMDHFEVGQEADIRFYAGVGAGSVTLMDVGGVDGHWRFLVAGAALDQVAAMMSHCDAGDVLLSADAHAVLPQLPARPIGHSGALALDAPEQIPVPDAAALRHLPEVDPVRLRPYLVESVLRRIDAGQTAWMAEFRLTSVLFIVVPEIDVQSSPGCAAVRTAVRLAQTCLSALDGSLNQVVTDDNGLVLLAAWGVPDKTHEDDPRRAMLAASEICTTMAEAGFSVRAGVATGRVFCGAVGSATRSRFALVGQAVNRAARIAMASPHRPRCDSSTRDRAAQWLRFDESETVELKGIDEPVVLFTLNESSPQAQEADRSERNDAAPIAVSGRQRERQLLEEALRDAAARSGQPLFLVEGDAGIGKSVLLSHLQTSASASGWQVRSAHADAVEYGTAYFPWRELFRELFEIDPSRPTEDQRQRVTERLMELVGNDDRLPLLEPVLNLGFEETETTKAMTGVNRGTAARELLAKAFDQLAGSTPLLVLEDLHWFDSASLQLITTIRNQTPRLLVAATTRPVADDALPQLQQLACAPGAVRIPLSEMDGDEVLAMVCGGLDVDSLPAELMQLLIERGGGHPLFTMELALLLRELGIIQIEGRQCRFDPNDPRLEELRFPEKAEGVVASRIDRLDPSRQLALKVSAVIGRSFALALLRDVYPIEAERGGLRRMLDALTRLHLVDRELFDPIAYQFRHVVIREVAYELVSFAQRRQLHTEIARTLESQSDRDISSSLPLLAHHWQMAEEPEPAMRYLQQAGEQALYRGAGHEALRFFQDALAIAEQQGSTTEITALQLAELERLCGEAYEQILDLTASSRWLTFALARLGQKVPTGAQRRRALVVETLRQLGHIIWPNHLRPRPSPEQIATFELAANAYGKLAEHCYFESDMMGLVLLSLMSVNRAEKGHSPHAAERSYLSLTQAVGLMGIKPLARRYSARSANSKQGRNQAFREIEYGGRLLAAGRLEQAAAAGTRAAELAHRYADRHHEAQGWGMIASAELRRGNADRAVEAADRMIPTGHLDWAYTIHATAAALSNRPPDAIQRLAEMDEWEPAFALGHLTMRMLWAEQQGDLALADERAAEALAEVEGPGMKNAFIAGHYANLLAYYSRRYRGLRYTSDREREATIEYIRRMHAELRRFCRLFPIGRPRLEQAAAILDLHAGRTRRGERHLNRGADLACGFGMLPEQVAMNIERARWKLPGATQALAEARALCEPLRLERLLLEIEQASE